MPMHMTSRRILHFAGFRYWTASVLPAIVGTTLPFWLRPPGFSFRWLGAVEFLIATVLMHSGFSFLQARFEHRATNEWSESRFLGAASACISGRMVVPAISGALCATLLLAVLSASIAPWALTALLSLGLLWRIASVSWSDYADASQMRKVRVQARLVHLVVCVIIAVSSLVGVNC